MIPGDARRFRPALGRRASPVSSGRAWLLAALLCVTGGGLSGCFLVPGVSCAGWVAFEDDQQRFEAADTVVLARVGDPVGRVRLERGASVSHRVTVITHLAGLPLADGDLVAQEPENCGDAPELLTPGDEVVLFLSAPAHLGEPFTTLTPYDGVRPPESVRAPE